MFEEYRDRVGELITGIVQQSDSRYTLVQLRERVEALLPQAASRSTASATTTAQRVKAVIKEVSPSTKGPSIIVSPPRRRADQEALRARGPRDRRRPGRDRQRRPRARLPLEDRRRLATPTAWTRSAPASARAARACAWSSPSCAARRSTSSPTTTSPPGSSPRRCRPARVREVLVEDEARQATVIVPDDQLSLAIGREGQNARLAARLTGWRIDIKSETEFAAEADDGDYDEGGEVSDGPLRGDPRQRPALPERALPGSPFCGLPTSTRRCRASPRPTCSSGRRHATRRSPSSPIRRARRGGRRPRGPAAVRGRGDHGEAAAEEAAAAGGGRRGRPTARRPRTASSPTRGRCGRRRARPGRGADRVARPASRRRAQRSRPSAAASAAARVRPRPRCSAWWRRGDLVVVDPPARARARRLRLRRGLRARGRSTRRALPRAFRRAVRPAPDLVESLN